MTTQHTPGPWTVKPWVEANYYGEIENTGLQVVAVDGANETSILSTCDERNGNREEADLYLIAAAPDLLEALRYAVKQVPELSTVPGIAAAIAKALGEK